MVIDTRWGMDGAWMAIDTRWEAVQQTHTSNIDATPRLDTTCLPWPGRT